MSEKFSIVKPNYDKSYTFCIDPLRSIDGDITLDTKITLVLGEKEMFSLSIGEVEKLKAENEKLKEEMNLLNIHGYAPTELYNYVNGLKAENEKLKAELKELTDQNNNHGLP